PPRPQQRRPPPISGACRGSGAGQHMKAFAQLLDRLSYSPSRNAKLRLMQEYFNLTADPDRGWALAALSDGLPFSFPLRRTLAAMMGRRMDPELFRLSRDYVGDTAETIALIWESARRPAAAGAQAPAAATDLGPSPRLADIVSELSLIGRNDL